jgi:hypothetical protein
MRKFIVALAAALFIAAPLAAQAQIAPTYADPAPDGNGEAQIHGRILTFDGEYSVQVRDEKGYVDAVQLHQGTIINPTGLTLAPGMIVSIMGYNAGSFFAANEIDTPYQFSNGYAYYGGHPWNYYGPSVSLGFFFGNLGWWHGGGYYGSPRYVGGVRYYNNVHVNTYYRGGAFAGRNYVAPVARGGYYGGGARVQGGSRGAPQGGSHGGGQSHGGGGHAESHGGGGDRHDHR